MLGDLISDIRATLPRPNDSHTFTGIILGVAVIIRMHNRALEFILTFKKKKKSREPMNGEVGKGKIGMSSFKWCSCPLFVLTFKFREALPVVGASAHRNAIECMGHLGRIRVGRDA